MAILQVTNSKYTRGFTTVPSMPALRKHLNKLILNSPRAHIDIIDAAIFDGEGAVDYLIYVDSELIGNVRGHLQTSSWQ